MTHDDGTGPRDDGDAGGVDPAGPDAPATPEAGTLDAEILEHAAEAVIYADREGRIRRWSRGCVALFGFTAEEALGQSLDLIVPERLRDAHWRGFHAAIERGATAGGRDARLTRALAKDGGRRYVEMGFAVVLGADGRAHGSVAVARDVTERELAARAAREAAKGG
ncbi:MAG: PAS domain S-box protein [Solirubrobacteraceae bacterium]|nr:PAS domain S-box protein [Solirubrobacteraceae bacterium]